MSTLPYYPGLIPPFPAGWGVYTPGTPGFTAYVEATQGDAGSSADGFDSALAAVMTAADAWGAAVDAGEPILDEIYSAADVFNSITDEVSAELLAAAALYDAVSGTLSDVLQVEQALGYMGPAAELWGMPGLASFALPEALDLFGWVIDQLTDLGQALIADFTAMLDSALESLAGGGGGTSQGYPSAPAPPE